MFIGIGEVAIDGPSVASVGSNVIFSVHLLQDNDEVRL